MTHSPMNIWSGSREGCGLAAALTNPTTLSVRKGTTVHQYPVAILVPLTTFSGILLNPNKTFPDAEAAYQALKTLCTTTEETDEMMSHVIALKFAQHPRLFTVTSNRGGGAYLATCSHYTGARSASFRSWEGTGMASRFIRNLVTGYGLASS